MKYIKKVMDNVNRIKFLNNILGFRRTCVSLDLVLCKDGIKICKNYKYGTEHYACRKSFTLGSGLE